MRHPFGVFLKKKTSLLESNSPALFDEFVSFLKGY